MPTKNNKTPEDSGDQLKESVNEVQKMINKADKTDPVSLALKKEQQPSVTGDLSPIHNTHATGTSGGDQRVPDIEPPPIGPTGENPNGKEDNPVTPVPVTEPDKGDKPAIQKDETAKATTVNNKKH